MQITQMDERIKVRADFTPAGKIVPLLFKRKNQDPCRITQIHATWEDKEGAERLLYFSVSADTSDDVFQLRYNEGERTWYLDSVRMDG